MAINIDYVVRMVKLAPNSGDRITIYINSQKFHEIEKYSYCDVQVIGQKCVFKFSEKTPGIRGVGGRISFYKGSNALYVARFESKRIISMLLPFCGEYSEVVYPNNFNVNCPEFWVNLYQKQNLTNVYKNTSTEISQVTKSHITDKPDNHEKVKKLIEENSIKSQLINSYKTSNNIDIAKLVDKQPAPAKIDLTQLNLEQAMSNQTMFAQYIIDEAHLCTQNMQRKFAALISHRLNKIPLSEEEAIKHYELNKLLVNYIRLQDSVEKLMQQFMENSGRRYKTNDSEGSV